MPSEPGLDQRSRVTVRRHPERGSRDQEIIHRILDEALFCHVGFAVGGQPFVIPTIHARSEDRLYVHGSTASRMLRALGARIPVCVTVTILDGLVLARSVFNHSMNYRSVVVLGTAHPVEDAEQKRVALRAIVEHVMPGRWAQARQPTAKEMKATSVLSLSLEEASAKIRVGAPKDDPEDLALPVWAGEVPVRMQYLAPRPDPALAPEIALPANVARAGRGSSS
ncbi:MAG: pyridoxamine 5'-phosphate oxidase family protein [Actinobacteria bacterium]|nr:pyridoxamine 5'-phosphate oxidase family protein [Actinomycetota bacterium]